MSLPSTNALFLSGPSGKPAPGSAKRIPANSQRSAASPSLATPSSHDRLYFGQKSRQNLDPDESVDYNHPIEQDYTLPERLLAAGKHGLEKAFVWDNGRKDCIKADFKKSLWITLLTLPFAFLIPGPQLAIPPIWIGYKALKRFYQSAKAGFNDPVLAEKRTSRSDAN